MSRRQLHELLAEVFAIPVSLGALGEAEARISGAIAVPVDEAGAHVRVQRVMHVDGSTRRLEGAHAAVWTIATKLVAVLFVTADSRTETTRSLLGTLSRTLVSDRGAQFGMWAMDRRQICWAQLIRKFAAFSVRKDEGAMIGDSLLLVEQAMISEWDRVRDGTLSITDYRTKAENAQHVIETLLKRGVALRLCGVSGARADVLAHRGRVLPLRLRGQRRADEQPRRARAGPVRALAQDLVRLAERARVPLRATHHDRRALASSAEAIGVRVPRRGLSREDPPRLNPYAAAEHPVNGYQVTA